MMFYLYNLMIHLAFPFIIGFLLWPKKGKPSFGKRWKEHLGYTPALQNKAPVWIHAVSVGETIAVTPLIRNLKQSNPELPILLTTTTRTGADQAARLEQLVEHRYAPLDYPAAVHRFLQTVQPRALVIMETELWPNLLHICEQQNIPVIILNARLSERSCLRYARFEKVFQTMTRDLKRVLCQTHDDAERFLRLGLKTDQVAVTGSIKYDMHENETQTAEGILMKGSCGPRFIWVAASTHRGEDELVLEAHRSLLQEDPNALLILIPRHPERFHEVASLCQQKNFSFQQRSLHPQPDSSSQVYLGDSMGEMWFYLSMADAVFMGGSFVPVGGHNVLEPAALSKPVLIGPHYFNFDDVTRQLIKAGGCHLVGNPQELTSQLRAMIELPQLCQQMGTAAKKVVMQNQGAIERSLSLMKPWLTD